MQCVRLLCADLAATMHDEGTTTAEQMSNDECRPCERETKERLESIDSKLSRFSTNLERHNLLIWLTAILSVLKLIMDFTRK